MQMVPMQQVMQLPQVQQQLHPGMQGWSHQQGAPLQIPQQQILYMDPQGSRQQPVVTQYVGQQPQQIMLPSSPQAIPIQRLVQIPEQQILNRKCM